jgi:hypothetical protein
MRCDAVQLVYAEAQGWRDQEAAKCPEVPNTKFKALKSSNAGSGEAARLLEVASHNYGGFQAGEKSQMPPKLFPGSLASYVLVFQTDGEWHDADLYPRKGEADISYAKLTMQPLVDKLRSADMIVREMYSSPKLDAENELPYMFALVSIGEKRQQTVAEIMSDHKLLRVRMRKMDDIGNEIKNGGAWTYFKQHLVPYYEKSSEGTLFSSAQQIEMMEFMMKEVDERAMGPQLMQKEACLIGNSVLQQLVEEQRIVAYYPLHHRAKRQWLSGSTQERERVCFFFEGVLARRCCPASRESSAPQAALRLKQPCNLPFLTAAARLHPFSCCILSVSVSYQQSLLSDCTHFRCILSFCQLLAVIVE